MADRSASAGRNYAPPVKAKKLTESEIKSSADRLATNTRKPVELPPLVKKQVLGKDTIDRSLERLYGNSVTQKKKMLEDLDKKAHPDMVKHTQLDQEAMEGMFNRLYGQSVQRKTDNLEKLKTKYMPETGKQTKLSKEQLGESASRLCNGSMDRARESHAKLFEKYVLETSPTFKKMTKDEIKSSADRLCAKK